MTAEISRPSEGTRFSKIASTMAYQADNASFGQGSKKKILWRRVIKVVRNMLDDPLEAVLPLEFVDRFQTQPTLAPMRHEVEHRRAVSGNDDGFALLHEPGKLSQPVLGFLHRDSGRHESVN